MLDEYLNMKTELEILDPHVFRERLWKQDLQFVWIRWFMDYPDAAAKPIVKGFEKNKQGELMVDGNIYVDMLTKISMVEKA